MTLKCVVISCNDDPENIERKIEDSKKMGADLAELMIDEYLNPPVPQANAEEPSLEGKGDGEAGAEEATEGEENGGPAESGDDEKDEEEGASDTGGQEEAGSDTEEVGEEEKRDKGENGGGGDESEEGGEENKEENKEKEGDVNGEEDVSLRKENVRSGGTEEIAELVVIGEEGEEEVGDEVNEEDDEEMGEMKKNEPRKLSDLEDVIRNSSLPVVCTLREESAGGRFEGDKEEKVELFDKIIELSPAYLEIEMEEAGKNELFQELIAKAKKNDVKVVISKHSYDTDYEDDELEELIDEIGELGADISKIGCSVGTFSDLAEIFSAVSELRKGSRLFCFDGRGKLGHKCSIFAPLIGSALAFCSLKKDKDRSPSKSPIVLKDLVEQWDILKT